MDPFIVAFFVVLYLIFAFCGMAAPFIEEK